MQKYIHRALQPMERRLANLCARGVVSLVNAAGKLQTLQIRLLSGEVKDNVEHFEPYGFTSHPLSGAEHFTAFLDGDRTHGITLVVTDRRYRLQTLPEGGVALYDSVGTQVVLNADHTLQVTATGSVTITSPTVNITGNLVVSGDITDGSGHTVAALRTAHNTHHGHSLPGGSTPDVTA